MIDKSIPVVIAFLWATFPAVVIGLALWPVPDPSRLESPRGLYVTRTHFLDEHGVIGSVPFEGNIYREGGPYMKCAIWSDGQRSWEHDPNWVNQTSGYADPNLRGNERPIIGKLGI